MIHKEVLGQFERQKVANWLRRSAAHMRKVGVHQGDMFDADDGGEVKMRERPCCWLGAMQITATSEYKVSGLNGFEVNHRARLAIAEHPSIAPWGTINRYNDTHPNPEMIPNKMDEVANWLES